MQLVCCEDIQEDLSVREERARVVGVPFVIVINTLAGNR